MSLAQYLNEQTQYQHGPKLGPGSAVEKINDGEGKNSYRGMPGMKEQDFKPSVAAEKAAVTALSSAG
ncbi:hypothetical protein BGX20_000586 [Mortierella sp. AD010]|nr:hypothetical protein BGX20_000586 [Mortierella sp. AD010]